MSFAQGRATWSVSCEFKLLQCAKSRNLLFRDASVMERLDFAGVQFVLGALEDVATLPGQLGASHAASVVCQTRNHQTVVPLQSLPLLIVGAQ